MPQNEAEMKYHERNDMLSPLYHPRAEPMNVQYILATEYYVCIFIKLSQCSGQPFTVGHVCHRNFTLIDYKSQVLDLLYCSQTGRKKVIGCSGSQLCIFFLLAGLSYL